MDKFYWYLIFNFNIIMYLFTTKRNGNIIFYMRKISKYVKEQLEQEPNICARENDGNCDGRITWEHALVFAGRQIDEVWAIIKLCEYHHAVNTHQDGDGMDKQKNIWVALNRATDDELKQYSKSVNYLSLRERLNKIYD